MGARKNKKIIWNIYVLLKKRENGVNFGIGKVGSRTKTAAMDSGTFTRAGRNAESHFYQSAAVGTTKRPRDTNPTETRAQLQPIWRELAQPFRRQTRATAG